MDELRRCAGTQFERDLVDAFAAVHAQGPRFSVAGARDQPVPAA